MPDPVKRELPKGQPKGAVTQQQDFLTQTQPQQAAAPVQPAPLPPGLAPEEQIPPDQFASGVFGDLSEVLFSPTERPEENIFTTTPAVNEEFELPQGPSDQYRRMLFDPRVSRQTKSMVEFVMRLRMLEPPATPPQEQSNVPSALA